MKKKMSYDLLVLALIATLFTPSVVQAGIGTNPILPLSIAYDSPEEVVLSLTEYNGRLFAGTTGQYSRVYVYDGSSWSASLDTDYGFVTSLVVYGGKLYANVAAPFSPGSYSHGRVFAFDGGAWTEVFAVQSRVTWSLAVHNGSLYLGSFGQGIIYVSNDGITWVEAVNLFDVLGIIGPDWDISVTAMQSYNGRLYAGTEVLDHSTGVRQGLVFALGGTTWSLARDTGQQVVFSLGVYNGTLYAGTGDSGVIEATTDGMLWSVAYDSPSEVVCSLTEYNGFLYAGAGVADVPSTSLDGVIYGFDGLTWTTAFDAPEAAVYSMTTYGGNLYAGTGTEGRIYGSQFVASTTPSQAALFEGGYAPEFWNKTSASLGIGTNPTIPVDTNTLSFRYSGELQPVQPAQATISVTAPATSKLSFNWSFQPSSFGSTPPSRAKLEVFVNRPGYKTQYYTLYDQAFQGTGPKLGDLMTVHVKKGYSWGFRLEVQHESEASATHSGTLTLVAEEETNTHLPPSFIATLEDSGTIEYFPGTGVLKRALVGDVLYSAADGDKLRRGFAEFDLSALKEKLNPKANVKLTLVENRGVSATPVPPDQHELSYYSADGVVDTADFYRATTLLGVFETDVNTDPPQSFTFDVTEAVLQAIEGGSTRIGFRVKLVGDLGLGSSFHRASLYIEK